MAKDLNPLLPEIMPFDTGRNRCNGAAWCLRFSVRFGGVALVLVFLVFATASVGQPASSSSTRISEITLEKYGCSPPCYSYKATLRRDGTATYIGIQLTTRQGEWQGTILSTDFDELAKLITQLDYFKFQEQYGNVGTHFGPVITSVVRDGSRKTVADHGRFNPAGPLKLLWIQAAIEVVLDSVKDWKQIKGDAKK